MKTLVHQESRPSRAMSTWIRPYTSTPATDPRTNPPPPVRSAPPITTAAIASSSMPMPVRLKPDLV